MSQITIDVDVVSDFFLVVSSDVTENFCHVVGCHRFFLSRRRMSQKISVVSSSMSSSRRRCRVTDVTDRDPDVTDVISDVTDVIQMSPIGRPDRPRCHLRGDMSTRVAQDEILGSSFASVRVSQVVQIGPQVDPEIDLRGGRNFRVKFC